MFLSDHFSDLPVGIITELGIDPAAVHEAIEDARSMRCPERPAVYPEHSFSGLVPESAAGGLGEAAPDEPWDPVSALPPA